MLEMGKRQMREPIQAAHGTARTSDGFTIGTLERIGPHAGAPLLVCLPGGSCTSKYFDVPGFSLLDAAAAGNIDAIALDRPNYGRSDVLPPQQTTFARNAEILDAAIASLWRRVGAGHSGVVLIGHSIGGAIAVHIGAMRSHDWPLLGLSVTAFAEESPQHVVDAWHGMPADQPLVFSQEQQRMFMFGPDGSFDADAVERSADVFQSIPLAELTEIVGGWRSDFPRLAAHVRVPVQYRLAEFDQLWIVSQERVDALRSKFTHARPVDAKLMAGTGHNIDFHHAGRAWHQEQLAFARQCSDLADPVRTT